MITGWDILWTFVALVVGSFIAGAVVKKAYKHPSPGALALAGLLRPLNIIVRQCAWCNRIQGFKGGGSGVSSGMCIACELVFEEENKKEKEG